MRQLLNGTDPTDLGTEIEGPQSTYEELTDLVTESPETRALEEPTDPEYGLLLQITPDQVARHYLKADTAALFYISDGAQDDPETYLRQVTAKQAQMLLSESISVAVDDIIRHYRSNPTDDGHPAYRLHELMERYRQRDASEKKKLDASRKVG